MARRGNISPVGLWLTLAALAAGAVVAQPQRPRGPGSAGVPSNQDFPPGWAGVGGNENDLGGSLVRTEGSGVIDAKSWK